MIILITVIILITITMMKNTDIVTSLWPCHSAMSFLTVHRGLRSLPGLWENKYIHQVTSTADHGGCNNLLKFQVDCGERTLTLQAANMMEMTAWEPFSLDFFLFIIFFFKWSYVLRQAGRVKIWPKCDETVSHQWRLSGRCIIHGWYLRSSIMQSKSLTIHTDTHQKWGAGKKKVRRLRW